MTPPVPQADLDGHTLAMQAIWLGPLIIFVILCLINRKMRHKVKMSFYFAWIVPNWIACDVMSSNTTDFLTLFLGSQVIQAVFLYCISAHLTFFAVLFGLWDEDKYNERS